jgi:hypothetical protein
MYYKDVFKIVKGATGLLVGSGVSVIVSQMIDKNTSYTNLLQRVVIFAGKTGISLTVSDLVEDHIGKKIDNVEKWWDENVANEEIVDNDTIGTSEQQPEGSGEVEPGQSA